MHGPAQNIYPNMILTVRVPDHYIGSQLPSVPFICVTRSAGHLFWGLYTSYYIHDGAKRRTTTVQFRRANMG